MFWSVCPIRQFYLWIGQKPNSSRLNRNFSQNSRSKIRETSNDIPTVDTNVHTFYERSINTFYRPECLCKIFDIVPDLRRTAFPSIESFQWYSSAPLGPGCVCRKEKLPQEVYVAMSNLDPLRHCQDRDLTGKTCLHHLCSPKDLSVVLGIEASSRLEDAISHCDVSVPDNLGRTVLHYCSSIINSHFLNLLSNHGNMSKCFVNRCDIFGQTALHYASYLFASQLHDEIQEWFVDRVHMLIQHGANTNVTNIYGISPLHLAVISTTSDLRVIELLLYYNADPNRRDRFGSTPLHYAAWAHCDIRVFDVLINHGANFTLRDCLHRTVMTLLVELGFISLYRSVKFLIVQRTPISYQNLITEDILYNLRPMKTRTLCDRELLQNETDALIRIIICEVKRLDERFESKIIRSGSVTEGTKPGEVDEFDYMIALTNFGKLCKTKVQPGMDGRGALHLKEPLSDETEKYGEFFDVRNEMITSKVKYYFHMLVTLVVHRRSTWQESNFMPLIDGCTLDPPSEQGTSKVLHMLWFGLTDKALRVSVDLVPAFQSTNWQGFDANDPMGDIILQTGGLLVFHDDLLRISTSEREQLIMHSLPVFVKQGFIKAKAIRDRLCSHLVGYRVKASSLMASKCVNTYALKMALFHVLQEHGMLALSKAVVVKSTVDFQGKDTAAYWCKAIYERLIREKRYGCHEIQSFFFPKRIIYIYGSKELDNVLKDLNISRGDSQ